MSEANKPEINVNKLMYKIRDKVAKNNNSFNPLSLNSVSQAPTVNLDISQVEALIKNAESRAYIRTKWPDKFNKFPFNFISRLKKLVLKLINLLFKDQRQVNFNLIQALRHFVELNHQLTEQISILNTRVDSTVELNHQLTEQISILYARMDKHWVDVNRRFQDPQSFTKTESRSPEEQHSHLLDAFYVAFEDHFRGSSEIILERLKVYLPVIEKANIGNHVSPILDVGCGRGEWLELLKSSGYTAKGLDINTVMLEQCKAKGFEVLESDVIEYLQSLPDNSLGAVTGFHIIEHLPFQVLVRLVDETLRVLRSGGLAIFESPNPENIIVGSCNFYTDPTHINPLVPATVKFLFEQRGFSSVELLRLREYRLEDKLEFVEEDNPNASKVNPLIEIVKSSFYSAPDFAIVAKKS